MKKQSMTAQLRAEIRLASAEVHARMRESDAIVTRATDVIKSLAQATQSLAAEVADLRRKVVAQKFRPSDIVAIVDAARGSE
jgi:hypothetical protein